MKPSLEIKNVEAFCPVIGQRNLVDKCTVMYIHTTVWRLFITITTLDISIKIGTTELRLNFISSTVKTKFCYSIT